MKPAIIPVATMLAVHMLAPSARAAAPQDVPLQLTLPSPDPAQLAQATAPDGSVPAPVPATAPMYSGSGFIANWLNTANQAQAMQPHWMTPLVTVTPRLEQEIRYDQYWEKRGNGSDLDIFDAGKGLELIPTLTNEILINPPAYQEKVNVGKPVSGWLDDQFLVVKQRLLTANEQEGNYIVTAFLQESTALGTAGKISTNVDVLQPTLALGKGWGNFDIQMTLSEQFPIAGLSAPGTPTSINMSNFGDPFLWNTTFQYHLFEYFWPELEVNYEYWPNGEHVGLSQVLLTPGVILGRFRIGMDSPTRPINLIVGAGYQVAVTPNPVVQNNFVGTIRITF